MRRRRTLPAAAALLGLLAAVSAFAQYPSRPAGNGVIHMETRLGSFRIIAVDKEPVTGTLTMTFTGSVLITGDPTAFKISGKVLKEYDNSNMHLKGAELHKVGYHGSGSLTVTGPLRSIEWFGSNMKGTFNGRAQIRLVGEFDSNLKTGLFWTDKDPTKRPWSANNVMTVFVPGLPTGGSNENVVPISRKQYEADHHY